MSNLGQILGDQMLRISDLEERLGAAAQGIFLPGRDGDSEAQIAEIGRQRKVIAELNERASRAEQLLAQSQADTAKAVAERDDALRRVAESDERAAVLQAALDALNLQLTEINASTFVDDRGRRMRWNAINRVRNVIEAHGGWLFLGDIRSGLADIPAEQVSTALLLLVKRGIIERQGEPRRYQYRAARRPE